MQVQFQTPHQYLFVHEGLHHLLVLWRKERQRALYLVEEREGVLHLTYPGPTYQDTVLHHLEPIFFQRLQTAEETIPAILGATFPHEKQLYGMYYHRDYPHSHAYFFRIEEEQVHEIPASTYAQVVQTFQETCQDYVAAPPAQGPANKLPSTP